MPARSKGCRVCVKRRVKCDGTRPVCQRCTKANLACDGPPSPAPVFQDETRAVALRFARKAVAEQREPSDFEIRLPFLCPAGSPDVYTDDVFCGYFLSNFFDYRNCFTDHVKQREWMVNAFQHPSRFPLSSLALRALYTCYFGRVAKGRDLAIEAKTHYGRILEGIRSALATPRAARSFDTLAAVSLLVLFECLAFTTSSGWIQHITGMSTLMEALGPAHFQQYPVKAVFTLTRPAMLYASMATRRHVLLEREEWHFDQPRGDPTIEHVCALRNICARVPGLMADTKHLGVEAEPSAPLPSPDAFDAILGRWLDVIADLRGWHDDWAADLPGTMPVLTPVDPSDDLPFADMYTYADLMIASAFCQYHAFSIASHDWIRKVVAAAAAAGVAPTTPIDVPALQRSMRADALRIAQSLPFILAAPGADAAKLAMLFQARRAYISLDRASPVAGWMQGILDGLARRNGLRSAYFTLKRMRWPVASADPRALLVPSSDAPAAAAPP